MKSLLLAPCLVIFFGILGTGCKKKEPAPKKQRREDIMRQAAADREAVLRFTSELRAVFEWRTKQVTATHAEVVSRFETISVQGLPEDLSAAWAAMLPIVRQSGPGSKLNNEARATRDRMNDALRKQGILDIKF